MTIELPRTALLGVGSMSGAVLDGLLAAGLDRATVTLTTKSEQSAAAHRERGLDATATDTDPDANRAAVRGASLVVLGVKPYAIGDLLDEVSADLEPGTVVVSVAVGTTTASMEAKVPAGVRVVRALPNTPIGVGHGVTGISAGASADADAVALASSVFDASGVVIEVPESQLDALSAVSGSGPAYVFLLVEQWQQAAESLGFSHDQAEAMVQGTLRGAVELLAASGKEPADLRRAVTSPKGTTERAVAVLQDADLAGTFERASRAAIARAEELAKG
ncbi:MULTISPECIES: pyrroline-5-carboxylate reductase [unclassified Curtobacterium]|uniref:pyrroline-5-carboxylate reductase n=1 Tax=unclassified Curtobacterium TaxID=257496 RepID=UPI00089DF117|nr:MULTISPECIES: pyrroline-5-carboxylate reductase [unclassified Curtobacterium]AOX66640.1 pyrroline-5-carboxylate reductase [Curtobacterium sp. BH-2-1-1]MDR6172342.1 pyrroline-5-carboxylate reductase [Curtobacterium sp. SORGH_AS_0776]OII24060.1 pyrroline-5-carboxylate reductase [Curtobacterium sp. MCBA15_013]